MEAFDFFNSLTGLAYAEDGFVVFLGTRSEAFARAIHKINEGSKAELAPSTAIENRQKVGNSYQFDDWRGLPWSREDKAKVARGWFETRLKKALRGQDLAERDVDLRANDIILIVCSHEDRTIRQIVDTHMPNALLREEEKWRATVQSRAQL